MEHNKLFRRFQRKLAVHALIRSALWGVAGGGAAVFICALVWHILLKKPAPIWLLGSLGIGFLIGFIPCFIRNFPTRKRTAGRLDRTGLQERAGTMLAYEKKDGLLVRLQRKDAAEHIEKTDSRSLKMAFPLKAFVCCVLCIILGSTMAVLPYDLFAPNSGVDPADTAREQQIRELIDSLRQQVREAELSEAAQKELEELLNQLEQDLLASDNSLQQAALIQEAEACIQETIRFSISRYAIGNALQNYSLTEELGIQLSGDFPHEISGPMDNLEKEISGPTKQISRLYNNLNNALAESGVDSGDILYCAFSSFAQGLQDMLNYTEGPDNTPAWTQSDLSFLFDIAEENILMALEEQAVWEAEVGDLSNSLSSGLNQLMDEQSGEAGVNEGEQGANNAGSSSSPSGNANGNPSGTPSGGLFDSGESNSGPTTMLEGIYDPLSGNVTYGEVFAAYYAQYLEALDAGEIPEELRPYFEKYFSSLS